MRPERRAHHHQATILASEPTDPTRSTDPIQVLRRSAGVQLAYRDGDHLRTVDLTIAQAVRLAATLNARIAADGLVAIGART